MSPAEEIKTNTYKYLYLRSPEHFPSFSHYNQRSNVKDLYFIWLDDMLTLCDDYFNKMIQPFVWKFFHNTSQCSLFLRNRLYKRNRIFLIASGSLGYELTERMYDVNPNYLFVYIYCAQVGRHEHWATRYRYIRGIFNESLELGEKLRADLAEINQAQSKAASQVRTD